MTVKLSRISGKRHREKVVIPAEDGKPFFRVCPVSHQFLIYLTDDEDRPSFRLELSREEAFALRAKLEEFC